MDMFQLQNNTRSKQNNSKHNKIADDKHNKTNKFKNKKIKIIILLLEWILYYCNDSKSYATNISLLINYRTTQSYI